METARRRGYGKSVLAIAILVVIVGATIFYYSSLLDNQANSSSSAINSLQSYIRTQQSRIDDLENQVGSSTTTTSTSTGAASTTPVGAGQTNGSVLGINPVGIYGAANDSVVTIQGNEQATVDTVFGQQSEVETVLGSGFVTTFLNSTYIITNNHVVDGVSNITVTFADGDAYPAKVLGTDPYSDLAVVTVPSAPAKEFVPLQITSSAGIKVGQPVVAIGNPYGLSGSMTFGIISQLGRTIQESYAGNFSISGVIQFSAPINPGNSGGPLFNADGMVIGITTAVVNGSQGVGFAIPSSTILDELSSLISTGHYDMHSYLGISAVDMDYQLAQVSNTNVTYGVLIESVVSGGPAAKAGLKAGTKSVTVDGGEYLVGGDIIIAINGTRIVSEDALSTYLEQNTLAGQTIHVEIIRGGVQMSVALVLGERPPPPAVTTAG